MAKKKGKKLQSKTRISDTVESSLFESGIEEATESAVAALSMKNLSPVPTVVNARQDVMENILKVLQEPTETMYKGLSQRAQNELSPQEVRELRELFSIFDIGGKGRLSYPVLRKSLKTMGFSADDKELLGAIADCNITVDEGVTFSQFVDIVLIEQGDSFDVYEELMSGFTAMDIERNDKITSQSLRKLCKRLDEDLSQAEIEDMISEADKDGNGDVSHKEFISVMLKTNLFRGTTANFNSCIAENRRDSQRKESLFS